MAEKISKPTNPASVDTSGWNVAGSNLKMTVLDGYVFLAFPLPTDKSKLPITAGSLGKPKQNRAVASSHGNITVTGTDVKLGLNAFTPA